MIGDFYKCKMFRTKTRTCVFRSFGVVGTFSLLRPKSTGTVSNFNAWNGAARISKRQCTGYFVMNRILKY
jgi:hypothetical protein